MKRLAVVAAAMVVGWGCAGGRVRPEVEPRADTAPRPARVLVYEFATSANDIHADQHILRQVANRVELPASGADDTFVAATFADALVARLQAFGIPAERADRKTPIHRDDVEIVGAFVAERRTGQMGRVAIGFDTGGDVLATEVDVLQSSGRGRQRIAQFSTHAANDMGDAALPELAFVGADQAAHQVARVFEREGWR